MGSCLGHFSISKETFSLSKFYFKARDNVDIQISNLGNTESLEHIIDDSPSQKKAEFLPEVESKFGNFKGLKSIFTNIKNKYNERNSSVLKLELLNEEWSVKEDEGEYSGKIENVMIPLSAKTRRTMSHASASINSLDLEWEHLPEMNVFSTNIEREDPKTASSVEAWSRISSTDSLEWDTVEVEIKDEIDTETEQLLHEIEMLSLKTLKETQEWAS